MSIADWKAGVVAALQTGNCVGLMEPVSFYTSLKTPACSYHSPGSCLWKRELEPYFTLLVPEVWTAASLQTVVSDLIFVGEPEFVASQTIASELTFALGRAEDRSYSLESIEKMPETQQRIASGLPKALAVAWPLISAARSFTHMTRSPGVALNLHNAGCTRIAISLFRALTQRYMMNPSANSGLALGLGFLLQGFLNYTKDAYFAGGIVSHMAWLNGYTAPVLKYSREEYQSIVSSKAFSSLSSDFSDFLLRYNFLVDCATLLSINIDTVVSCPEVSHLLAVLLQSLTSLCIQDKNFCSAVESSNILNLVWSLVSVKFETIRPTLEQKGLIQLMFSAYLMIMSIPSCFDKFLSDENSPKNIASFMVWINNVLPLSASAQIKTSGRLLQEKSFIPADETLKDFRSGLSASERKELRSLFNLLNEKIIALRTPQSNQFFVKLFIHLFRNDQQTAFIQKNRESMNVSAEVQRMMLEYTPLFINKEDSRYRELERAGLWDMIFGEYFVGYRDGAPFISTETLSQIVTIFSHVALMKELLEFVYLIATSLSAEVHKDIMTMIFERFIKSDHPPCPISIQLFGLEIFVTNLCRMTLTTVDPAFGPQMYIVVQSFYTLVALRSSSFVLEKCSSTFTERTKFDANLIKSALNEVFRHQEFMSKVLCRAPVALNILLKMFSFDADSTEFSRKCIYKILSMPLHPKSKYNNLFSTPNAEGSGVISGKGILTQETALAEENQRKFCASCIEMFSSFANSDQEHCRELAYTLTKDLGEVCENCTYLHTEMFREAGFIAMLELLLNKAKEMKTPELWSEKACIALDALLKLFHFNNQAKLDFFGTNGSSSISADKLKLVQYPLAQIDPRKPPKMIVTKTVALKLFDVAFDCADTWREKMKQNRPVIIKTPAAIRFVLQLVTSMDRDTRNDVFNVMAYIGQILSNVDLCCCNGIVTELISITETVNEGIISLEESIFTSNLIALFGSHSISALEYKTMLKHISSINLSVPRPAFFSPFVSALSRMAGNNAGPESFFSFDGVSSSFALPELSSLPFSSGITFSAWIRTESIGGENTSSQGGSGRRANPIVWSLQTSNGISLVFNVKQGSNKKHNFAFHIYSLGPNGAVQGSEYAFSGPGSYMSEKEWTLVQTVLKISRLHGDTVALYLDGKLADQVHVKLPKHLFSSDMELFAKRPLNGGSEGSTETSSQSVSEGSSRQSLTLGTTKGVSICVGTSAFPVSLPPPQQNGTEPPFTGFDVFYGQMGAIRFFDSGLSSAECELINSLGPSYNGTFDTPIVSEGQTINIGPKLLFNYNCKSRQNSRIPNTGNFVSGANCLVTSTFDINTLFNNDPDENSPFQPTTSVSPMSGSTLYGDETTLSPSDAVTKNVTFCATCRIRDIIAATDGSKTLFPLLLSIKRPSVNGFKPEKDAELFTNLLELILATMKSECELEGEDFVLEYNPFGVINHLTKQLPPYCVNTDAILLLSEVPRRFERHPKMIKSFLDDYFLDFSIWAFLPYELNKQYLNVFFSFHTNRVRFFTVEFILNLISTFYWTSPPHNASLELTGGGTRKDPETGVVVASLCKGEDVINLRKILYMALRYRIELGLTKKDCFAITRFLSCQTDPVLLTELIEEIRVIFFCNAIPPPNLVDSLKLFVSCGCLGVFTPFKIRDTGLWLTSFRFIRDLVNNTAVQSPITMDMMVQVCNKWLNPPFDDDFLVMLLCAAVSLPSGFTYDKSTKRLFDTVNNPDVAYPTVICNCLFKAITVCTYDQKVFFLKQCVILSQKPENAIKIVNSCPDWAEKLIQIIRTSFIQGVSPAESNEICLLVLTIASNFIIYGFTSESIGAQGISNFLHVLGSSMESVPAVSKERLILMTYKFVTDRLVEAHHNVMKRVAINESYKKLLQPNGPCTSEIVLFFCLFEDFSTVEPHSGPASLLVDEQWYLNEGKDTTTLYKTEEEQSCISTELAVIHNIFDIIDAIQLPLNQKWDCIESGKSSVSFSTFVKQRSGGTWRLVYRLALRTLQLAPFAGNSCRKAVSQATTKLHTLIYPEMQKSSTKQSHFFYYSLFTALKSGVIANKHGYTFIASSCWAYAQQLLVVCEKAVMKGLVKLSFSESMSKNFEDLVSQSDATRCLNKIDVSHFWTCTLNFLLENSYSKKEGLSIYATKNPAADAGLEKLGAIVRKTVDSYVDSFEHTQTDTNAKVFELYSLFPRFLEEVETQVKELKEQGANNKYCWEKLFRELNNGRGPWGTCEKIDKWELDTTENSCRMRMKLRRNFSFDMHEGSARNYGTEDSSVASADVVEASAVEESAKAFVEIADGAGEDQKEAGDGVNAGQTAGTEETPASVISAGNPLEDREEQEDIENILGEDECELVKPTFTIPGRIIVTSGALYFKEERTEGETRHYNDMKWTRDTIAEIHMRLYLLRNQAFEVFFVDKRNVFFHFKSNRSMKIIHNKIVSGMKPPNIAFSDSHSPREILRNSGLTELWVNRKISNFEYLMRLNTIAGRTYNDLSQYPVFPWILKDYHSETLDLSNPETFRDLSKPAGLMNPAREKPVFRRYREAMEMQADTGIPPSNYGTHYSNADIVLQYLIRLEKFTTAFLRLQKFDFADRMFHSVGVAFDGTYSGGDVKELIPEFFYLPDFLRNDNGFDLGTMQSGTKLNHVELPPWAHGSPEEFIRLHREALESEYVSEHLNDWIDLIFGYKQRGEDAVKAGNVFSYISYPGSINLDKITDEMHKKSLEHQILCFGQTPLQLLKTPHPKRCKLPDDPLRCIPLCRSSLPVCDFIVPVPTPMPLGALLYASDGPTCNFISLTTNRILICGRVNMSKLTTGGNEDCLSFPLEKSSQVVCPREVIGTYISAGSSSVETIVLSKSSKFRSYGRDSFSPTALASVATGPSSPDSKTPDSINFEPSGILVASGSGISNTDCMAVMGKIMASHFCAYSPVRKLLFTCGYWDNSFKIHSPDGSKLIQSVFKHSGTVNAISISETGRVLATGSEDTTVMIWHVNAPEKSSVGAVVQGEPSGILTGHTDVVTSLDLCEDLDVCVSGSRDGLIILHTIRTSSFVWSCTPFGTKKRHVISHIRICPQTGFIVVCFQNPNALAVLDINGRVLARCTVDEPINDITISPDGKCVVSVGFSLTIRSMHNLEVIKSHPLSVVALSAVFSPGGNILFVSLCNSSLLVLTRQQDAVMFAQSSQNMKKRIVSEGESTKRYSIIPKLELDT